MTIYGNAACCDTCGAGVSVDLEAFEGWETIPWRDGPATHLCDTCLEKRERGVLVEPFFLECVRCGRNTKDNPEAQRWKVLSREWGDPGKPRHVCGDCFQPEDRLKI